MKNKELLINNYNNNNNIIVNISCYSIYFIYYIYYIKKNLIIKINTYNNFFFLF